MRSRCIEGGVLPLLLLRTYFSKSRQKSHAFFYTSKIFSLFLFNVHKLKGCFCHFLPRVLSQKREKEHTLGAGGGKLPPMEGEKTMPYFQFSSMTHAGKAYTELRRHGIEGRIEKGSGGGCAFRLTVAPDHRERSERILRDAHVAFQGYDLS